VVLLLTVGDNREVTFSTSRLANIVGILKHGLHFAEALILVHTISYYLKWGCLNTRGSIWLYFYFSKRWALRVSNAKLC